MLSLKPFRSRPTVKYPIYYLLLFYTAVCGFTILNFNGTGDSGDSISHYLFARYAPFHPVLYFDHWAKPVFVLLASPFAQFGFTGIKVFNSLVALCVIFFTYRCAERMNMRRPLIAALILIFCPLFYILTFSGLTEPLFALFTVLGLYFCLKQKYLSASIVISFLPYVRSEGLILIGVFAIYFLFRKNWKTIPFLLTGSILYGLAGFFVHGTVLWVFTEIPYATAHSVYGHGELLHFVKELLNVTGVPIYILFWIGFITLLVALFRKQFHLELHILVFGGLVCFFVAHSLFWYLGVFNSMGLKRVLIGVIPFIALIAIKGFELVAEELPSRFVLLQKALRVVLIGYIVVFPFTVNPSAINWQKDLKLSPDQDLAIRASKTILENNPSGNTLYYNYNYLSLPLHIDYFDPKKRMNISAQTIPMIKTGDILIWENLYAEFETGLKKELFDKDPGLNNLGIYTYNEKGREIVFSVYKKK